jgi:hypothetical protein
MRYADGWPSIATSLAGTRSEPAHELSMLEASLCTDPARKRSLDGLPDLGWFDETVQEQV